MQKLFNSLMVVLGLIFGLVQCAPNAIRVPMLDDAGFLLNWALFDWENPSTSARVIINYAEQGGDAKLLSDSLQKFDKSDEEAMFLAGSALAQSLSNGTENTLLFTVEAFEQLSTEDPELLNQLFIAAIRGGDERASVFALVLEMLVRRNGCSSVEALLEVLNSVSRAEGKMETYIYNMLEKAGPAVQCQNCEDIQNGDTSCSERQSYGQCEEDWMKQGYNCALTCGYCEYIDPASKPQAGDLEQLITERNVLYTGVKEPEMKGGVNKDELVFGDASLMSESQADKISEILGGSGPVFSEQKANTKSFLSQGGGEVQVGEEESEVQGVQENIEQPAQEAPVTQTDLVSTLSGLLTNTITEEEPAPAPVESGISFSTLYYEPAETVVEQQEASGASTVSEALQNGDIDTAANLFAELLLMDDQEALSELVGAIEDGYSDAVAQLIARMVIDFRVVFSPFVALLNSALNEVGEPVAVAIAQGLVYANNEGATDSSIELLLNILNNGGTTTINMVLGIERELAGENCGSMLQVMEGVQEQAQVQELGNAQLSLLMLGTKISDGCAP